MITNMIEKEHDGKNVGGKHTAILLFFAILAAIALRMAFLQEKTFFIDETFSWQLASHSVSDILAGAASESNPPLPMLIFHYWQKWAKNEWELRFICLLMSVAAVAAVYVLGARVGGRAVGPAAAAICAFSGYQIENAQIYRYPALAILIGAISYCLLWRWTERGEWKTLPPLALVFAIGIYTHYFFVFLIISANIFVLFRYLRDARRLALWATSQVAVALAFVPWLSSFMKQSGPEIGFVGAERLLEHLKTLPFFSIPNALQSWLFGPYPIQQHPVAIVFTVLFFSVVVYRLFLLRDALKKWFLITNLSLVLALPYAMMLFLGLRLQTMYHCMFSCLLYVIIVATLFEGRNKTGNIILSCVLSGLIANALYFYYSNVQDTENNKSIISYIENNAGPDDIVVVNPTYQSSLFNYYMTRNLKLFGIPRDFEILKYNFNDLTQVTDERLEELNDSLPSGAKVWAFYGFGIHTKPDSAAKTFEFLSKNHRAVELKRFAPTSFAGDVGLLAVFEKP